MGANEDSAGATPDPAADLAAAADDLIERLAGVPEQDGVISSFTVDGAEVVLEELGSGPRLFLLLHGIGMGRRVFADLAAHLAPHGRVWMVDQPGYGEAAEPPRTPTMPRLADFAAALLRDRGETGAVVIGHSMGTQVAVELTVRHPALVGALVLAGPTVDPRARTAAGQLLRLVRDLAVESPRVFLLGGREYLRAGPHLRQKMAAMLVHRPEEVYPRVAAPTLVLRGAEDHVAPREWCRGVATLIPDAQLVELADHGHETLIRDARPAADRILAFLAG